MSTIKADAITASTGTNTNIAITGKGSGKVKLGDGNLLFPDADGSANQYIKTDGSGNLAFATLSAGAGCWTLITETTASSSAAVDFTLDNSTYQMFMVIVNECRPAAEGSGETLVMRYSIDGGSNFKSGSGHYDFHNVKIIEAGGPTGLFGGASETVLQPYSGSASGQGNAAHELLNGQFFLNQTGDADSFSNITCSWCNFRDSANAQHASWGQGYRTTAEVNNAVRFFYTASSAIAEGNFKLYGQVK